MKKEVTRGTKIRVSDVFFREPLFSIFFERKIGRLLTAFCFRKLEALVDGNDIEVR